MSNSQEKLFDEFQCKIGYKFTNVNLLEESLTHCSLRSSNHGKATYQRLEWLGDAVLQLIISEYLFFKHPDYKEGQLTPKRSELVDSTKQKLIAEKLDIEKYFLHNPGLELDKFGGHDNFVESIIGAIYVDAGVNGKLEATKFIRKFWEIPIPDNYKNEGSCVIS